MINNIFLQSVENYKNNIKLILVNHVFKIRLWDTVTE